MEPRRTIVLLIAISSVAALYLVTPITVRTSCRATLCPPAGSMVQTSDGERHSIRCDVTTVTPPWIFSISGLLSLVILIAWLRQITRSADQLARALVGRGLSLAEVITFNGGSVALRGARGGQVVSARAREVTCVGWLQGWRPWAGDAVWFAHRPRGAATGTGPYRRSPDGDVEALYVVQPGMSLDQLRRGLITGGLGRPGARAAIAAAALTLALPLLRIFHEHPWTIELVDVIAR